MLESLLWFEAVRWTRPCESKLRGKLCQGAYPSKVSAIYTSMQSWHEDLVIWRWDVGWIGNETASRNVTHTLEEAAVVNLQHNRKN